MLVRSSRLAVLPEREAQPSIVAFDSALTVRK